MKHLNSIILMLIIITLIVASINASEIQLRSFVNTKYGFKLKYPSYCNEIIENDLTDQSMKVIENFRNRKNENPYFSNYGLLNEIYSLTIKHEESYFFLHFGIYKKYVNYSLADAAIELCRIKEMYPDYEDHIDTIQVDGISGLAIQFTRFIDLQVTLLTAPCLMAVEKDDYNYIIYFVYNELADPDKYYNSYYQIVDLISENFVWLKKP